MEIALFVLPFLLNPVHVVADSSFIATQPPIVDHSLVLEADLPIKEPLTTDFITAYIAQTAQAYGINPQAALLLSFKESHWNPKAVGDNGTSYGVWQIHNPVAKGMTIEQAEDINYSTNWAMKTMLKDGGCRQWSTCKYLTDTSP